MVKSTEVSYAKVLNCATRVMSDSPGLVDFANQASEFCSKLARQAIEVFGGIQVT